jgi:cytochrome P450
MEARRVDIAEAVGDLLAGAGRDNPYPVYERIRAFGPLARVQERFYVATGYEAVDAILRDPRMLMPGRELAAFYGTADGPANAEDAVIGGSLLRSNPPDHGRMRPHMSGAFTPRRLAAMRSAVETQAATLVGYLEHIGRDEPVDFINEFAYPLPIRVICALLGVPAGDQHWFRAQAEALTTVLEPTLLFEDAGEAAEARSRLDLYFVDLIAAGAGSRPTTSSPRWCRCTTPTRPRSPPRSWCPISCCCWWRVSRPRRTCSATAWR